MAFKTQPNAVRRCCEPYHNAALLNLPVSVDETHQAKRATVKTWHVAVLTFAIHGWHAGGVWAKLYSGDILSSTGDYAWIAGGTWNIRQPDVWTALEELVLYKCEGRAVFASRYRMPAASDWRFFEENA